MSNDSVLLGLQSWFYSNCDGDREHSAGIQIATLDNPGWSVIIDLSGTPMAGVAFEELRIEKSDDDWYHCRTERDAFRAWCGVHNLVEVIEAFLVWTRTTDR